MQRTSHIIQLQNSSEFKKQLLQWAQQFKTVVWLDSNDYHQKHSNFEAVLAVDTETKIESSFENAFSQLKKYQTTVKDYIFGFYHKEFCPYFV